MENLKKPSIMRLSKCAGVKSISDKCFDYIREDINKTLENIIEKSIIINSESNTKTLMSDDIYKALSFNNYNLTKSDDLSSGKCT